MAAAGSPSIRCFIWTVLWLLCRCSHPAAERQGDGRSLPSGGGRCTPYVHWISQGVSEGETVMVVGWCFGGNPTLLLDGHVKLGVTVGIGGPLHNYTEYGPPRSLMSEPLPTGFGARKHTLTVVDDEGRASNTVHLNDAELWWVQGDEGEAASGGGWIRAFGRELTERESPDEPTVPAALRQDWQQLVHQRAGWDTAVQLERLRELVATHGEWLAARPAAPTATLTLTPLSTAGAPIVLTARAGASTHAAEFAVPVDTTPGEYNVSIRSGEGGAESVLDCFENLNRTRVRSIVIVPPVPSRQQRPTFFVEGPSGLNLTQDTTQVPAYGTKGPATPIDATENLKRALAKAGAAAATAGAATVAFRAGAYHVDGPIVVPHGVTVAGAGSDLTAVYFSYDNVSTAPQVLLGPSAAHNSWGIEDLSVYVLGFFRTVVHVPADESGRSRFRMRRVTVRADAFHCQNGMMGKGGGRAPPWFPNCDGTCGTQGGYENAVMHLGRLENVSHPQGSVVGDVSTLVGPAVNAQVEDCDISSSWHIFQGTVRHFVARNNVLWNGGMAFYLIPRESIIEGNDATGSSVISGGGGYNFAQHLYHANNRIRNIRGNDREVMTFDGEDNVFYGTASMWNDTHVITPDCPGRPDSRYAGNNAAGSQIMIVDGPGTGQYRRVVAADMPPVSPAGGEAGVSGQDVTKKTAAQTRECMFELDKPFVGLENIPLSNITITIAAFTGLNIFDRNTFEDGGPFQFYNSGVHDVASGMTFRRTEGTWNSGMDVAANFRNGSKNVPNGKNGCPNPSYFNEFSGNKFEVGHRAPHLNPAKQERDNFWSQPVAHGLFSAGFAGQGRAHSNRFVVFRGNSFVGANGISIWGIGTSDVLVEGNRFNATNISIALDHFPTNISAVTNVLIHNNTQMK